MSTCTAVCCCYRRSLPIYCSRACCHARVCCVYEPDTGTFASAVGASVGVLLVEGAGVAGDVMHDTQEVCSYGGGNESRQKAAEGSDEHSRCGGADSRREPLRRRSRAERRLTCRTGACARGNCTAAAFATARAIWNVRMNDMAVCRCRGRDAGPL
jgi:hypothetical protein